jgi:hypothetical protein
VTAFLSTNDDPVLKGCRELVPDTQLKREFDTTDAFGFKYLLIST